MISRSMVFGLSLATIASIGISTSASAQRVSADIHIGGYPVAGTVRIGERYPRPRGGYYERARPVRIVVDHRRGGWNPHKYRNARMVVVYYDRDCDLFFDRYSRGLEEVRVYQDGGRYFRFDDDRWDRRDRDRDRHDRYDRDRRDRHDRNDRNDRDDDRWEHDHRH